MGGGGGINILGTQGWEKLGEERIFFLQAGGELTLDDTMTLGRGSYGLHLAHRVLLQENFDPPFYDFSKILTPLTNKGRVHTFAFG